MKIDLSNFGHNNRNGVVAYKGKPIAIRTNRGWSKAGNPPEAIAKAVSNAIFALPNNTQADKLRRRIGEELGL